jgi:carbonic anhydrase
MNKATKYYFNKKGLMRVKRLLCLCVVLVLLLSAVTCTSASSIHSPGESVSDWQSALQFLKDGNQRYAINQTIVRDTNANDRAVLKSGQHPFAVIVTCADSRVSPEIYFDQKLGDIFVIRNAGNITDETALGSIEYAVEHLHVPLVVVVGHSACGAVTGAFNGGEFPKNLNTIINAISASIKNSADLDNAIRANVNGAVRQVKDNEVVHETKAMVMGAYYNIETGEVSWLQ